MKKFEKLYNWVVNRVLVKEPLKHGSYFLSHGFCHFIMCIIVMIVTYIWARDNINSSDTTLHNLEFQLDPLCQIDDSLTCYSIDFILDSDSLLKSTNGNYSSQINYRFGYYWNQNEDPDTVAINFNANIDPNDIEIVQDSVYYSVEHDTIQLSSNRYTLEPKYIEHTYDVAHTHNIKKRSDDISVKILVKPSKNLELPSGMGYGPQNISIRSKQLGLKSHEGFWEKIGLGIVDANYNYYIHLPQLHVLSGDDAYFNQSISFQFGDINLKREGLAITNKKLLYNYIYPEPDYVGNGYIEYRGEESISKVSKNRGIIIQATDIDAQNRNTKKSIISSVLVGTGTALFFDILIQLIRELRNVNRRKEKEQSQEQEEK